MNPISCNLDFWIEHLADGSPLIARLNTFKFPGACEWAADKHRFFHETRKTGSVSSAHFALLSLFSVCIKKVYLSLGSNLGYREQQLELALAELDKAGISVIARSSVYETEPQDVPDQPWFLNLVVACETKLFPIQLLKRLQRIEAELGRSRGRSAQRRGPRAVDLDILLFSNSVIGAPELTVPHPRMTVRRFVLEPLAEIAPDLRDPVTRKPFTEFLTKLSGQKVVKLERLTT